jgi:co-chaperonin GroES (HSP10)
VKIRFLILSALISIGLLYVACGQPQEKAPGKAVAAGSKRSAEQKKAVRVRHLSGEVLAVNAKTKTITVRFKDEDVYLTFDDSTVVKVDLDSVKPSEIPLGARATVKYIERKGQHIAKGIFISTETAEKKEGSPQSFFRNSAKHDAPRAESPLPCSA